MAATEQATTDKPKKAFKILRLNYYHESPKILFDLPREVRDTIWSYALTETTLYNKRHKSGCAFHNHAAAYQVPPALLLHQQGHVSRRPLGTADEDIKRCRQLCVRRQGFGLMKGVNKQIQHEASEIFYENNTICFPELLSNHQDNALISKLQRIPRAALQHTRKLALWQVEDYAGVGTYKYARAKIIEVLRTLPNLTHLEIPTVLLEPAEQAKIFTLPNLETFRTYALRPVKVTNGNDFVPVYVAVGQEWRLPSCRFKRTPNRDDVPRENPLQKWCLACQTTREEILTFTKDLNTYRSRWQDWTEHAATKLARLEPAQPDTTPYTLHARLSPRGKNHHEMRVWGLPIHPPAIRAAEARKAAKRENLANLTRKTPTALVFEEAGFENDGDFVVTGLVRSGRQRRAVEKRVDHEKLLEERGNRARNVKRAEAVRGRKEVVKSEEERRVAEEEIRNERKAAAKRHGRRDS